MAEENKPEYHSSRAEEYLNYLVGSSDEYPQDKPQSRAEEYLQYLCAHKGEGGGGAEPLIVYTEGTMQTSTLPAIVVPRLTKDQLDNIHTAMSQGKLVLISDGNGHYTVTEIDETYDGVRFVYANAYVDYYLEGDNVVCAHTLLEGGGSSEKVYHNIRITGNVGNSRCVDISLTIVNESTTPFNRDTLIDEICSHGNAWAIAASGIMYNKNEKYLKIITSIGSTGNTSNKYLIVRGTELQLDVVDGAIQTIVTFPTVITNNLYPTYSYNITDNMYTV